MITTIGVSYILFNIILLTRRRGFEELPQSAAADPLADRRRRAATSAWS